MSDFNIRYANLKVVNIKVLFNGKTDVRLELSSKINGCLTKCKSCATRRRGCTEKRTLNLYNAD